MDNSGFIEPRPLPHIADPTLERPGRSDPTQRQGPAVKLDWNENADPVWRAVVDEIARGVPAETVCEYPNMGRLYHRLAKQLNIETGNLLIAAGSDDAIRQLFQSFVAPGDTVVLTNPSFGMYGVYAQIFGANAVTVDYQPTKEGPEISVDTLLKTINDLRPKVVCLPNPDSPTGTVMTTAELRAVIHTAGRIGTVISIDEAYYPFHPETVLPWVYEYPHLIVLRSTSKSWAMAGLRIGYAVGQASLIGILHKVRPMFEIGNLGVEVFYRILDREEEMLASVRRLNEGRDEFRRAMDELGLNTFHCHANFQHVAFGRRADDVHAALDGHVLYRSGSDANCLSRYSRFSATTVDQFQPVIDRIQTTLAAHA